MAFGKKLTIYSMCSTYPTPLQTKIGMGCLDVAREAEEGEMKQELEI